MLITLEVWTESAAHVGQPVIFCGYPGCQKPVFSEVPSCHSQFSVVNRPMWRSPGRVRLCVNVALVRNSLSTVANIPPILLHRFKDSAHVTLSVLFTWKHLLPTWKKPGLQTRDAVKIKITWIVGGHSSTLVPGVLVETKSAIIITFSWSNLFVIILLVCFKTCNWLEKMLRQKSGNKAILFSDVLQVHSQMHWFKVLTCLLLTKVSIFVVATLIVPPPPSSYQNGVPVGLQEWTTLTVSTWFVWRP